MNRHHSTASFATPSLTDDVHDVATNDGAVEAKSIEDDLFQVRFAILRLCAKYNVTPRDVAQQGVLFEPLEIALALRQEQLLSQSSGSAKGTELRCSASPSAFKGLLYQIGDSWDDEVEESAKDSDHDDEGSEPLDETSFHEEVMRFESNDKNERWWNSCCMQ